MFLYRSHKILDQQQFRNLLCVKFEIFLLHGNLHILHDTSFFLHFSSPEYFLSYFEMSISINKWNDKQMQVEVNISTHEMYIHACCNKLCVTACMIEIEPHSEEQ